MPNAIARIRPSIKKGIVYTYEVGGELSDAAGGITSFGEAVSTVIALAESEPWGNQIASINISITAPDPEP